MSTPKLVTEFYERLWHAGDHDALREVLHENVSFRGSLGSEVIGAEAFWMYLTTIRGALADYCCEVLECVAEEDTAFAKMRFSGTHIGVFRGFRPTGRRVEWLGAAHFVMRGGRIAKIWVLGDLAGLDATLRENEKAPNKAPEPTPGAVMPRAIEGNSR
jgi:predicted ester cyclase